MQTSQKIGLHKGDGGISSAEEKRAASGPFFLGNEANCELSKAPVEKEDVPIAHVLQIEQELSNVTVDKINAPVASMFPIKREPSPFPDPMCPNRGPTQFERDEGALAIYCGAGAWQCGICSKYLSSKSQLDRHAHQVHRKRQRYQCDVCPKTYACVKSLKEHKRFHTGEKPHACHLCPAAFVRRSALLLHIQAIHDVSAHRACAECGRKFAFRSTLKRHLTVHTGETPHCCHLCPKRFSRTDRLLAHLRAHDDESPHRCRRCYRRFEKGTALAEHVCTGPSEEPINSDEPTTSRDVKMA